jgi:hypothetical protein
MGSARFGSAGLSINGRKALGMIGYTDPNKKLAGQRAEANFKQEATTDGLGGAHPEEADGICMSCQFLNTILA